MARDLCIEKLTEIIPDLNICNQIENSIYKYAQTIALNKGVREDIEDKVFKRIYVNKLISLYTNLDKNSYIKNQSFYDNVMEGSIPLDKIAFLTPQEINKEHWKKYLDRENAADEFRYSKTIGTKTSAYKCDRCKKRDCSYYLLQVRSSDEPMTTFVNCLNCGNKWNFS